MPLYEYRCLSCDVHLEVMQSIRARPKRRCMECGGKLEKLVSRSGFVLKGSGWYATDFKDGGKKKPRTESAPTEGKGRPGEGKASEPASKPAGPADAKPGKAERRKAAEG